MATTMSPSESLASVNQQTLVNGFAALMTKVRTWNPALAAMVRAARDAGLLNVPSAQLTLHQLKQKVLVASFLHQAEGLREFDLAIQAILDVAFERAWGQDRNPSTSDTASRAWAREVFTFQKFPNLRQLESLRGEVHACMERMAGYWDAVVQIPTWSGAPWERYCRHCTTVSERLKCTHFEREGHSSPR